MTFICCYSNCFRRFACFRRSLAPGYRLYSATSDNPTEDEAVLPKTMFEYYQKNPRFLKRREEIKFDIQKEINEEKEKETRVPPAIDPENATWTEGTKRVGAIGVKLGMIPLWLKNGKRVPVTMVQVRYNGDNMQKGRWLY